MDDVKGLKQYLRETKKDCLMLQKRKDLTEFGLGQLKTIEIIEEYIKF